MFQKLPIGALKSEGTLTVEAKNPQYQPFKSATFRLDSSRVEVVGLYYI